MIAIQVEYDEDENNRDVTYFCTQFAFVSTAVHNHISRTQFQTWLMYATPRTPGCKKGSSAHPVIHTLTEMTSGSLASFK